MNDAVKLGHPLVDRAFVCHTTMIARVHVGQRYSQIGRSVPATEHEGRMVTMVVVSAVNAARAVQSRVRQPLPAV